VVISGRINQEINMIAKLILLFTAVPLIELFILVKLGTVMGVWPTVGLVILTGVIGAYLVRLQGIKVATRIKEKIESGRMPTEELWNGAFLLVAGATLITPGLITDILGFTMLIPLTRSVLKKYLVRWTKEKWLDDQGETYMDIEV